MTEDNPQSNSDDRPMDVSEFQQESHRYYDRLRELHTGVINAEDRMRDEKSARRYFDVDPVELSDEIQNLASFFVILRALVGTGSQVRGIDFGCGSHWCVAYWRSAAEYGWDAVGYDSDRTAIEMAKRSFPESSDAYRCRDLLREKLPEASGSQNFVLCNAVLQHFDNPEIEQILREMARVLQSGGVCVLIFKAWRDEFLTGESGMQEEPRVLDAAAGKVYLFDPTMKKAIDAMTVEDRDSLDDTTKEGWRLFHLLRVEEVVQLASSLGLRVTDTRLGEKTVPGIIRYRSGKKIPTACVLLRKGES